MLDKIQELGYAQDPDYAQSIKQTPEYQFYSKRRKKWLKH